MLPSRLEACETCGLLSRSSAHTEGVARRLRNYWYCCSSRVQFLVPALVQLSTGLHLQPLGEMTLRSSSNLTHRLTHRHKYIVFKKWSCRPVHQSGPMPCPRTSNTRLACSSPGYSPLLEVNTPQKTLSLIVCVVASARSCPSHPPPSSSKSSPFLLRSHWLPSNLPLSFLQGIKEPPSSLPHTRDGPPSSLEDMQYLHMQINLQLTSTPWPR